MRADYFVGRLGVQADLGHDFLELCEIGLDIFLVALEGLQVLVVIGGIVAADKNVFPLLNLRLQRDLRLAHGGVGILNCGEVPARDGKALSTEFLEMPVVLLRHAEKIVGIRNPLFPGGHKLPPEVGFLGILGQGFVATPGIFIGSLGPGDHFVLPDARRVIDVEVQQRPLRRLDLLQRHFDFLDRGKAGEPHTAHLIDLAGQAADRAVADPTD